MLNDKIKEFYPAHATPGFLEWLNEQIGVEIERVLEENHILYHKRNLGDLLTEYNNKDLVNLIKEEL